SGRAALDLLACCPQLPTDVLAALLGLHHRRSSAQLLHHLSERGWAHRERVEPGPLIGPPELVWSLTAAGQECVQRDIRAGRGPNLPMLLAGYRLLVHILR